MRRSDYAASYMKLVDLTERLLQTGLTSAELAVILQTTEHHVQSRWRGSFPTKGRTYIERLQIAGNLAEAVAKAAGAPMVATFFRIRVHRLGRITPLEELAKAEPDTATLYGLPEAFAAITVPRIVQRRLELKAKARRDPEERSMTHNPEFMAGVREAIRYLTEEIKLPKAQLAPLLRANSTLESARTTLSRIALARQQGMDVASGERIMAIAAAAKRLSERYEPARVVGLIVVRIPPTQASMVAIAVASRRPQEAIARAVDEFLALAS